MEHKDGPPRFLHYKQEISTPTKEECDKGYLLPFDIEEQIADKFFNPDKAREVASIVRELIINCHEHGNKFDPHKKVTISVDENSEGLTVTIKDEGPGYPSEIIEDLEIPFWQKPIIKRGSRRGSGFYGVRKSLEDKELDNVEIQGNEIKLTMRFKKTS